MRPRKNILLFCENPVTESELVVLLDVRGRFKVIPCVTLKDVESMLSQGEPQISLLVAEVCIMNSVADCMALIAKRYGIPSLLFSRTMNSPERATHATHFIPELYCTPQEILEKVRIFSQGKRGPKRKAA